MYMTVSWQKKEFGASLIGDYWQRGNIEHNNHDPDKEGATYPITSCHWHAFIFYNVLPILM